MTKSDVLRKIVQLHNEQNAYIDSIPNEFSSLIFDNEYTNCCGMMVDTLIDSYFGNHAESISWFLYEWKPGFSAGCVDEAGLKVTVDIDNIDDYITYMKEYEGFDD